MALFVRISSRLSCCFGWFLAKRVVRTARGRQYRTIKTRDDPPVAFTGETNFVRYTSVCRVKPPRGKRTRHELILRRLRVVSVSAITFAVRTVSGTRGPLAGDLITSARVCTRRAEIQKTRTRKYRKRIGYNCGDFFRYRHFVFRDLRDIATLRNYWRFRWKTRVYFVTI